MKAIEFTKYGSFDVLKHKDVEKPAPKENEVLIKVKSASINDWDLGLMQGKPYLIRLMLGMFKPKYKILGVDVAGTVEAVGNNVSCFSVGDNVYGDLSECGFGAFAEYVCANEKALIIKPEKMTFEDAASLPHAAMLAIQGLFDYGNIVPKQDVLFNGAGGGVGTIGIQIAKEYNINATGVDSSEKTETLKASGFQHVIDYKTEDFTRNGKVYDLILDTKTNRSPFAYVRSLKKNGIYVTVGGSMSKILQIVILKPFIYLFSKKTLKVLGLKPNKDLVLLNNLYKEHKVKPIIDGPYKLSEVPRLLKYFGDGKHKGKIVINDFSN